MYQQVRLLLDFVSNDGNLLQEELPIVLLPLVFGNVLLDPHTDPFNLLIRLGQELLRVCRVRELHQRCSGALGDVELNCTDLC